ncbi:MAG: hypothetical protein K0R29_930 [Pseudobdellovibrio sp.]|jgi:hypothetical protein|nr:hypothetical protein [Pseudobdellovibrio sp.]
MKKQTTILTSLILVTQISVAEVAKPQALPQLPPIQIDIPEVDLSQIPGLPAEFDPALKGIEWDMPSLDFPRQDPLIESRDNMRTVAIKSLSNNIVQLKQGLFLSAGSHQFKSFWTRDFCFASRGLLAMGRKDVVKSHLTYLLHNRRADNLVPLYVDSIEPVQRVIADSLFRAIRLDFALPITSSIKPYYLVNNEHEAIDSNLMVLYASLRYYQESQDAEWFNKYRNEFRKIYDYYNSKKSGGLIVQGVHADWQDSARRNGKMFFTNLLYYHMGREYAFLNAVQLQTLRNKIVETFYDRQMGVFLSMEGRKNVSLEGNLWAIEHDLIANKSILYQNLKAHQLYRLNGIPGFATYPSYTNDDTYIQVKIVGLQEYHGAGIYWTWLMAYSAKIAFMMQDQQTFDAVYKALNKAVTRDQSVVEIYKNDGKFEPFRSVLYGAESPFSWGAGFVIDMEKYIRQPR